MDTGKRWLLLGLTFSLLLNGYLLLTDHSVGVAPRAGSLDPSAVPLSEWRMRVGGSSDEGAESGHSVEALQALFDAGQYEEALAGLQLPQNSRHEELRTQWLASCTQWILDDPGQPRIKQLVEAGLRVNPDDIDFRQLQAESFIGLGQYDAAIDLLYALIHESDLELQGVFASRLQALFSDRVKTLVEQKAWQPLVNFAERLLWHEPAHPPYLLVHARALARLERYSLARGDLLSLLHDSYYGGQARQLLDEINRLSRGAGKVQLVRHGAHHIVSAVINGRHSARMMIDTGASTSVLSKQFLRRADLSPPPQYVRTEPMNTAGGKITADIYQLASFQLDDFVVNDLEVAVIDMEASAGSDGLLGMNYLRYYEFAIDQQSSLLTLSPRR